MLHERNHFAAFFFLVLSCRYMFMFFLTISTIYLLVSHILNHEESDIHSQIFQNLRFQNVLPSRYEIQ